MRLQSIELSGYIRFLSGGTKSIVYTPNAPIQLILANNGFGKSSLLNELSPLPANQGDFIKGGFKKIEIEHNHQTFKLTSDFSKGNHHYFELDGENLNPGRTGSVQKVLVEQYFKYNQDIHQLALGKVKFTQLTATKRKELLTLICKTDITYATALYNRLSSQARNNVGARKHTEEKLIQHRSTLLPDNELIELRGRLNRLHTDYLSIAQSKHNSTRVDYSQQIHDRLMELSEDLLTRSFKTTEPFKDLEEYSNELTELNEDYLSRKTRIREIKTEHDSLTELLNQLKNNDTRSIAELTAELQRQQIVVAEIELTWDLSDHTDVDGTLESATNASSAINDLLLKMPVNPNMELYSRESVTTMRQKQSTLQSTIDRYLNDCHNTETRLRELEHHQRTQCPDCGYTWIPGLSDKELATLKSNIEKYQTAVVPLQADIAIVTEWLQAADEWKVFYARFINIMNDYPRLTYVRNYLLDEHRLFNEPARYVGWINQYADQLRRLSAKRRALKEVEELEYAITTKQRTESMGVDLLTQRLISIEDRISTETRILESVQLKVQAITTEYRMVKDLLSTLESLNQLYVQYENALINKEQTAYNAAATDYMNSLQEQIGLLSDRVDRAKNAVELVAHLEQSLVELDADEVAYQLLMAALSPSEGLIADTLYQFSSVIVHQINDVIRAIWTTPLKVLPCNMDNNELDYKFPLEGVDVEYAGKDISESSDGQQEIINFAFLLVARVQLEMTGYPLHMDETGRHFSELHRMRTFEYIKHLVEAGLANQVFVVSHFPSTHGTLTHADRNVIDPTGVLQLPGDNQYFQIR